jgi:hypothetical protein
LSQADSTNASEPSPASASPRIRFSAMAVGMGLCLLISVGLPYGEFIIQGTRLGLSSSTPAAFFLLFLLVVFVQPVLGTMRRSWLFNRSELLLVAVMMMMATAVSTRGFTGVALAVISGSTYYATSENDWAESLIPHIPDWIAPRDEAAIKAFYEGLPQGTDIPWEIWFEPLGWWLLFMTGLYCVIICSMSIMRRQWMEHERLLYPLVQVPLTMIEDGGNNQRLKPFLKNPLLWIGFAVPVVFNTINALSHYYQFIPNVELNFTFSVVPETPLLRVRLNYLMIGLVYFINTGISFSLWIFFLLAKFQEGVCATLGIYSAEPLGRLGHMGPTMGMHSHQTFGAMVVLMVMGLWTAREHLRAVWAQVWSGPSRLDSGEFMSYRAAVMGLWLGLAIMGIWLWQSGMPLWVVPLFLFAAFAVFFALTRVIVEAGLSSAVEGLTAGGFVVSGLGSSLLGPGGLVAMGYTLVWAGDMLVFAMAPCANGIRLLHEVKGNRKRILLMMAASLLIALLGSIYTTLKLGYQYGALNMHRQYFSWFAQEPFKMASQFINTPIDPNWAGWGWNGVGAGVMALLMFARHNFLSWPLHPIGFVVGGTWIMNNIWFSIFLAWSIKSIVLRYLGPRGYRTTRWFFMGLILGQFVVGGVWLIIDGFTGMTGNQIRMY